MATCIRDDSVRRLPPELVFDQDTIGHELYEVGDARPIRWAWSRLDFDWDETIGRLDEIVGFPNESISPRHQGASQWPPAVRFLENDPSTGHSHLHSVSFTRAQANTAIKKMRRMKTAIMAIAEFARQGKSSQQGNIKGFVLRVHSKVVF